MALVFEVTLGLGALALFGLILRWLHALRVQVGALDKGLRQGLGVLATSVGEATAAQRREMAEFARQVPAATAALTVAAAPSSAAREGRRKVAEKLDAAHERARQALAPPTSMPSSSTPEITVTEDDDPDKRETIELPPPPDMTVRPAAPVVEDEPEELTAILDTTKGAPSAIKPVKKTAPPAVLKNTGYRYVGPPKKKSDPPVAVLRGKLGADLEFEDDDNAAERRVQELADAAGMKIGEGDKTPPSGTPVIGTLGRAHRAGLFQAFESKADYPKVEMPAPHRRSP